jgi:hypothetical protein
VLLLGDSDRLKNYGRFYTTRMLRIPLEKIRNLGQAWHVQIEPWLWGKKLAFGLKRGPLPQISR